MGFSGYSAYTAALRIHIAIAQQTCCFIHNSIVPKLVASISYPRLLRNTLFPGTTMNAGTTVTITLYNAAFV
jgi:hypothetical protein